MILFLTGLAGGVTGFIFDFRISSIFISNLILPLLIMLFYSDIMYVTTLQVLIFLFYIFLLIANKHLNQLFYDTHLNLERYHWAKEMLLVKEKKLTSLLKQAPIGIFYYDKDLKLLNHNTMFYKIFGLEKNLEGFNLNNLKDKEIIKSMNNVLNDESIKEEIGSYNLSFHKKEIWLELTCSALLY